MLWHAETNSLQFKLYTISTIFNTDFIYTFTLPTQTWSGTGLLIIFFFFFFGNNNNLAGSIFSVNQRKACIQGKRPFTFHKAVCFMVAMIRKAKFSYSKAQLHLAISWYNHSRAQLNLTNAWFSIPQLNQNWLIPSFLKAKL